MTPTLRNRFLLGLAAAATVVATAGCSASDRAERSHGDASRSTSDMVEMQPSSEEAPAAARAGDDAAADSAEPLELGAPAMISTGTVSLESDDVGATRFEVRKVVDRLGGRITDQETSTGEDGEISTARLVLRVPSESFSEATAALEQVATLTGSSAAGEDVTAEVVDVEARIRAQRKSVSRIEALLARAESLEQIVTIEAQLSSRQAELDSLLSRQAYLADQTSQSTITVYLEQTRGEESDDSDSEEADGFLGGLERGWDSFVSGGGDVLTVLGFAVPWLGLALLAALLGRLLFRRFRKPTAGPTASAPTPQGPPGPGSATA